MSATATLPSTRNKEQLLAWANRQKTAPLSPAQAAAMDSVHPTWRKTLNDVWYTNLEAAEAFVAVHGFFPRAAAKNKEEKLLGVWIATQRHRVNLLSADRITLLDGRLPGWNKSKDEAWKERLEKVCAIVAELGYIPRSAEKDSEGRRAAFWLKKHAKTPATDPRFIILNKRIPGWNDRSLHSHWQHNLDALEAFVTTHSRFPTQNEKGPEDRLLGTWLHTLRHDRLPVDRKEELTRRAPGWDRAAVDKWTECLDFAAAYLAEHGKLPTEHSADPIVASSAQWVGKQRRAASQHQHREAALDTRLPGWRVSRDDKWDAMLTYVEAFVAEHGRMPSGTGSGSDQERKSTLWLRLQRKGTGMTPDREARLDALAPLWRETPKDAWHRKLADYEAFYKANGRQARATAKDAAERTLGVWLRNTTAGRISEDRALALAMANIGVHRSLDQSWLDTVDLVAAFKTTHGRFPTGTAKEPGERPLATWLTNHRSAKAGITSDRRNVMAARISGWDITFEDIWNLKLQQCVDFVRNNGRLPKSSKIVPVAEQKLASWIVDRRKPKNMARLDRVAMLNEKLPGWR